MIDQLVFAQHVGSADDTYPNVLRSLQNALHARSQTRTSTRTDPTTPCGDILNHGNTEAGFLLTQIRAS